MSEERRMVALQEISKRLDLFPEMLAIIKDAETVFDAIAQDGHMTPFRREVWAQMISIIHRAENVHD